MLLISCLPDEREHEGIHMTLASDTSVLIVDDQGSMRLLVQRTVREFGFKQIRCTGSPREALSLVKRGRVQLIISDYQMPELNGLELLAMVRSDPATTIPKFIMLTGSGERSVVGRAITLGVDDYLVKPFRTIDLRTKMQRLIGSLP